MAKEKTLFNSIRSSYSFSAKIDDVDILKILKDSKKSPFIFICSEKSFTVFCKKSFVKKAERNGCIVSEVLSNGTYSIGSGDSEVRGDHIRACGFTGIGFSCIENFKKTIELFKEIVDISDQEKTDKRKFKVVY